LSRNSKERALANRDKMMLKDLEEERARHAARIIAHTQRVQRELLRLAEEQGTAAECMCCGRTTRVETQRKIKLGWKRVGRTAWRCKECERVRKETGAVK